MLLAAVYGGYFGAGVGVIFIGVLSVFINDDLQRLNGVRNVLSAVANAVVDALSPLGITHLDIPLLPERVWRAIQGARASGSGGA